MIAICSLYVLQNRILPVRWSGPFTLKRARLMTNLPDCSGRTAGGRFAKGVSGNPAGRPRGARNKVTIAVETLLGGQPDGLAQVAVAKALKGNMAALRICMDRIAPAPKSVAIEFDLPPITCAADAVKASAAVLVATAAGELTPDEATRVMALITAHKALVERAEQEAGGAGLGKGP